MIPSPFQFSKIRKQISNILMYTNLTEVFLGSYTLFLQFAYILAVSFLFFMHIIPWFSVKNSVSFHFQKIKHELQKKLVNLKIF